MKTGLKRFAKLSPVECVALFFISPTPLVFFYSTNAFVEFALAVACAIFAFAAIWMFQVSWRATRHDSAEK